MTKLTSVLTHTHALPLPSSHKTPVSGAATRSFAFYRALSPWPVTLYWDTDCSYCSSAFRLRLEPERATSANDNLPITINFCRKSRGRNSMQIIESTCCHFFFFTTAIIWEWAAIFCWVQHTELPAPRERVENSASAVPVNISYNDRGRIK